MHALTLTASIWLTTSLTLALTIGALTQRADRNDPLTDASQDAPTEWTQVTA